MIKAKYFSRESQFREYVLKTAVEAGFHPSHIESPQTSAGVPDLNLFRDVDIWLELKVWSPLHGVRMRPTQKRWHIQRHNAKGISWVLVYHQGKLSLIPGHIAAHLKSKAPEWTFGYMEGPLSQLKDTLQFCQREVVFHRHQLV